MTNAPAPLMTGRAVADLFNVQERSVQRWERAGRLRGHRLAPGGEVLYFRRDVMDLYQRSQPRPPGISFRWD
jgi:hypothetical protein